MIRKITAVPSGISNLALDAEPNFAEAYILKALLQYHDGDTEAAQASLKRASELNPHLGDDMRKHLEEQAHTIEQGLTSQDFSHFHLEFHGATERDKAWDSVKYLDEVYNDLGSRFGVFPSSSIPVIIFNTQEFWEAWNAPSWLGGFFDRTDGKIRVRIDSPPGGDDEMKRRLRHEFTHAYIYQLYPHELPMWFQEGTAQFYAYANPSDAFWKDTRLEELRKITRGAPWMSMDDVQTAIAKKNVSPGLLYLAYLESESLALYIGKERGESWVPALVTELPKGKSFDDAFKDSRGIRRLPTRWRSCSIPGR